MCCNYVVANELLHCCIAGCPGTGHQGTVRQCQSLSDGRPISSYSSHSVCRRLAQEQGTTALLRGKVERFERQGVTPSQGVPPPAVAPAAAAGRGGGPLAALGAPDLQRELASARERLTFQEQEVTTRLIATSDLRPMTSCAPSCHHHGRCLEGTSANLHVQENCMHETRLDLLFRLKVAVRWVK